MRKTVLTSAVLAALALPAFAFAANEPAASPTPAESSQSSQSAQSAQTSQDAAANETPGRDLFSDTWIATDALGRKTPTIAEVGPVKNDGRRRVVGIFYITWHTQNLATLPNPYTSDVSKVLTEDPAARLDGTNPAWHNGGSFHWGEPETGYFLSQDEYVIRRDMSQLVDAGVDVIILDVTNAVCYWDEWEVLFKTMETMKAEGNRVPRFCFWSFNGPSITIVQQLFDAYYKTNKYSDLWFYWDGKPLILCNKTPEVDANRGGIVCPNPHYDPDAKTDPNNPHYGDPDYAEENYADYTKEVKDFFTMRGMWWGYYEWNGERYVGTEDHWSFGYDLGNKDVAALPPEKLLSTHNGVPEEAAVTPAQHPISMIGKSWTRQNGEPKLNELDRPEPTFVPWLGKTVDGAEGYGIYFQERWDEALAADPQFLYLNDWNEWTAGKYPGSSFLGRDSDYFFVDQYNAEFNRTIQPAKGEYTDNYYMQTVDNIRRYKGVRPIPTNRGETAFDAAAPFAGWDKIDVEYRDTVGDVVWRDAPGYAGNHYVDQTGRNDFVASKVGVDGANLRFFAETAKDWTPATDANWGLLLVDADQNPATGWFGYDLLINQTRDGSKSSVSRWVSAEQTDKTADADSPFVEPNAAPGSWEKIADVPFVVEGKRLVVSVPRDLLGATGDKISFDFKWADNPNNLNDPISLCVAGDTAPNRRFNYRFVWEAK